MDSPISQRLAGAAVGGSWVAWFLSNLAQINEVLQFLALVAAITSSLLAARFYVKRSKQP